MRRTFAALSTVTAITVAACSPSSAGSTSMPTVAASGAPAAATEDNKHKVCLGYRQREHLARTLIDASSVLVDSAASADQIEKTSNDIRQAYAQERSWVETQLPTILDPQVKSAFQTYGTALTQDLTELESAGQDRMKIANIIFGERISATHDNILNACKNYGLLPRPLPSQ